MMEDISGVDLKTDSSIQKICELSSVTSANTRSIWYIIVIVSALSFAECWNTYPGNRASRTIHDLKDSIYVMQKQLVYNAKPTYKFEALTDTVRLKYDILFKKNLLDILNRSLNDNINIVKIPILGNSFDIRDLGIFAGFAFIVLLIILKFILIRKVSNLRLAFRAITKRYTPMSDGDLFVEYVKDKENKGMVLEAINYSRRKYHYYLLSVNEVFNITLKPQNMSSFDKIIEKCSNVIFFIPVMICVLLSTIEAINYFPNKENEYWGNYIATMTINLLYIVLIIILGKRCNAQSIELKKLYAEFEQNNCTYQEPPLPIVNYGKKNS